MTLNNKTLFITGASRGIGLAIAKRAAKDGARIAVIGKTTAEDPRIPGTIYSAANEIVELGGSALPIPCDVRDETAVKTAIELTVAEFGGIDCVINNASAIDLRGIDTLDIKKFDLMHQVNARATYLVSKLCLPYLRKSTTPHILTLSPPLDMNPKWFSPNLAYTMAKYGMSMVTLGLANELQKDGIAVNSLWPETLIATAAVANLPNGEQLVHGSRKPEIVADAAHYILCQPSRSCTGNFYVDTTILAQAGQYNLENYAINAEKNELFLDLFLENPISKNVKKINK